MCRRLPKPVGTDALLALTGERLGLTWIAVEPVAAVAALPEPSDMVMPPAEVLRELATWAHMGGISRIQTYLRDLQATEPQYNTSITQITVLAYQFEDAAIQQRIHVYLQGVADATTTRR